MSVLFVWGRLTWIGLSVCLSIWGHCRTHRVYENSMVVQCWKPYSKYTRSHFCICFSVSDSPYAVFLTYDDWRWHGCIVNQCVRSTKIRHPARHLITTWQLQSGKLAAAKWYSTSNDGAHAHTRSSTWFRTCIASTFHVFLILVWTPLNVYQHLR